MAEDLEAPVADANDDGQELAENAMQVLALLRPLREGRKSNLNSKRVKTRKRRVADRQLAAQVHTYNRQGHARTQDYNMQPKGQQKLEKPKGVGGWKKWTPEAILKAGSSDPTATNRSSRIQGGSHVGVSDSRAILAETIVAGQERGLAAIVDGLPHKET